MGETNKMLEVRAELAAAYDKLEKIANVAVSAIRPTEVRSVLEAVVELRDQRDAALRDAAQWQLAAKQATARLTVTERAIEQEAPPWNR